MKESTLIEMKNRIEILGNAVSRLMQEQEMLKTMVMGDHQVLKQLKEFPDIIQKMKDEQKEDTSGAPTGDSGLVITDE